MDTQQHTDLFEGRQTRICKLPSSDTGCTMHHESEVHILPALFSGTLARSCISSQAGRHDFEQVINHIRTCSYASCPSSKVQILIQEGLIIFDLHHSATTFLRRLRMEDIKAKHNLVGAIIFFSYIVAALGLTGIILYDMYSLYGKARPAAGRPQELTLRLLTGILLASISFATLSYFMLSFLILSYTEWSQQYNIALPLSLIGQNPILGSNSDRTTLYIWRWATSSTLFQDFAETIISPPSHYFWTQKALAYSFLWNCYMADKGKRPFLSNGRD